MKKPTREIGQLGEALALQYLQDKHYEILCQNYRYRRYEIDIIAQQKQTLVFIEVKYRKNTDFGLPEETLTEAQADRIMEAAEAYIWENNWNGPIRFDIIAISGEKQKEILHFEDAVY